MDGQRSTNGVSDKWDYELWFLLDRKRMSSHVTYVRASLLIKSIFSDWYIAHLCLHFTFLAFLTGA